MIMTPRKDFLFTANTQKGSACPVGADSLLLVLLAKMRSSVYADFHEGQPTLVNCSRS